MRIVLIDSGGFVGVPLQYEVDVSELGAGDVPALERALVTAAAEPPPPPTSAGETCIRLERDDGSVNELTLSHSAPAPEIAELVQRLRACAKMMRKPTIVTTGSKS
jgi:hypothetical protein